MANSRIELRLIGRGYCHLCDDMAAALAPIAEEFTASVKTIDVDENPALLERYDELVPVLLHGETELCHHFLNAAKVREYLAGIR